MDLSFIKEARKAKYITQQSLADQLGISIKHLNLIENNKADCTIKLLEKILIRLDVELTVSFKAKKIVPQEVQIIDNVFKIIDKA